jgi:hypothetical protein
MNAQTQPKEDGFEFEIEGEEQQAEDSQLEPSKSDVDVEIEDDTPEEDRDRTPLPKELVEKLELDELDQYSGEVKTKLKQLKKVWHDERRAKEEAFREQQKAVDMARRVMEENKNLKSTLNQGEQTLVSTYKQAAELEMEMAKRAYKEAYDSGDSDKVIEAQQKIADATFKIQRANNYVPNTIVEQKVDNSGNIPQNNTQVPKPDEKTLTWQRNNPWWGVDSEMTASALGLHQKLAREFGGSFVGTDDYWRRVDVTMRRRFPEYFGTDYSNSEAQKPAGREAKPATVVAPASRSTSSKRVVLTKSEVNLARKFGLTPEQYAREKQRLMEKDNG